MNKYLDELKIDEFSILLKQFHIDLDDSLKREILNIIKNNQYALINDEYQSIIENCIKKLTSEHTCQKFNLLFNNYFKPLLNT